MFGDKTNQPLTCPINFEVDEEGPSTPVKKFQNFEEQLLEDSESDCDEGKDDSAESDDPEDEESEGENEAEKEAKEEAEK